MSTLPLPPRFLLHALICLAATFLLSCGPAPADAALGTPHVRVVVEGLLGPVGMALLPDGGLLVAEEGTGGRDESAGVTLITPDGEIGRFLSGLPSSRDAGDLAGVPLVHLSPGGDTLYVGNFGQGHLWTLPLTPSQQAGLALPDIPLTPDDLLPAMRPLNNVRLVNPFDMTFDRAGVPVVTDASGNGVAKQTADDATRFFHRFAELPNPARPGDFVEAVPTGIERVAGEAGDEYYVTLTGGCPYPAGSGRLVAIDEARNERVVLDDLNMPIDVALGPDGTLWLLEFARFTPGASCFDGSGYNVETGRLSRVLPDGSVETVLDSLNFPGAVLPLPDGSLYISEVLPGRVLHVTFGESPGALEPPDETVPDETVPETNQAAPDSHPHTSPHADATLRKIIAQHELTPNPGAELREGETPLAHLGQLLFFDPILSGDQNTSCASCHHPAFAMADGRVLPIGTGGHGLGPERTFVEQVTLADESTQTTLPNPFIGQFVPRNSPTIINSALLPVQFWDGRVEGYAVPGAASPVAERVPVKTLERAVNEMGMTDALAAQALFPVTSLLEMAGSTHGELPPNRIRSLLVERLRGHPDYVALFRTAFADRESPDEITIQRVVEALAAFERQLIFTDAPWDRYLAGDPDALTEQQKAGALLFFGAANPDVNCASCHSGDLFTDLDFHNLMVPQLGPGKGHGYSGREDRGRAGVTFDWRDRYAFRTPSLRNVSLTAPYFHDGAFPTLSAAIRHHANIFESALTYDPAAHGIPEALYSSLQPASLAREGSTAAAELRNGLPLSASDVDALVAFLESLTDPAAQELHEFIPPTVPSGLPLDPLPTKSANAERAGHLPAASAPEPATPADAVTPDGITFRNVAETVGLDFRHGAFQTGVSQDPVAAMGGGLCWIDFDRDGWLDLYLVNSHADDERRHWEDHGGLPRNALYRNVAGRFEDVSRGSGTDVALRGNGCVAADFDGDGWTDLFVTADGSNALFWNRGDGTFEEGAAAAGVDAPEWNSAAAVGDLNRDGLLDLFVAAYLDLDNRIPKPTGHFPQDYYGLADRLYINRGVDAATGRAIFTDVAADSGLVRTERGLGALFTDLDDDGDLDLYIANDGHPNRLYANEPLSQTAAADPLGIGFRWRDLTGSANVGDSGSGMGVAGGDYDGDGQPDLFVTNWERELNALYRNESRTEGHLTFQYSTFRIGIRGLGNGMTGWGAHLADFDQDTDADLLFVNGRVPVTNLQTDPELVRFYANQTWSADGAAGRAGHFRDGTAAVGLEAVGPLMARGSAVADYDNDGDLDIAINSIGEPVVLLQNDANDAGTGGSWLQLIPQPSTPGLTVQLTLPDGRTLHREPQIGSSYLASEDPRLHVGLGGAETVPQIVVRWPDGHTVQLTNVAANGTLVVER